GTGADRPPHQSIGIAEPHTGCGAYEAVIVDAEKRYSRRAIEHQGRADITPDTSADACHEVGAQLPLAALSLRRIDADIRFDPQNEPMLEQVIVSEGDTATEGGV